MMDRKLPPPPVEDSVSLGRTNVVASKDTNRATFNVYAENMNIPGSNNRVNVAGTVDNSVHINIEQATDFFGPGWKVTRRYRIHPNTEIGKILEVAGPADTNEVVGIEVPDNLKVEVLDGYETTDVRIGDAAGSAEFNPAKNAYRPKEWTGTKQIRVRRKGNPTFEMKIPLLHLKIWPDKEKKPDDSPVEFQIPEGSQ